jgi:hypothetical protein
MTTTSANTGLLPERVETAARERIAASLATFPRKIDDRDSSQPGIGHRRPVCFSRGSRKRPAEPASGGADFVARNQKSARSCALLTRGKIGGTARPRRGPRRHGTLGDLRRENGG